MCDGRPPVSSPARRLHRSDRPGLPGPSAASSDLAAVAVSAEPGTAPASGPRFRRPRRFGFLLNPSPGLPPSRASAFRRPPLRLRDLSAPSPPPRTTTLISLQPKRNLFLPHWLRIRPNWVKKGPQTPKSAKNTPHLLPPWTSIGGSAPPLHPRPPPLDPRSRIGDLRAGPVRKSRACSSRRDPVCEASAPASYVRRSSP